MQLFYRITRHGIDGVFTLTVTDTETGTKNRTQWLASVSEQSEHLNTVLYNPFFIGIYVGLSVGLCETPSYQVRS